MKEGLQSWKQECWFTREVHLFYFWKCFSQKSSRWAPKWIKNKSIVLICLTERRKLAKQPETVSVAELKSLLVLTRKHFLDHFDAVIPKMIPRKMDKIKTFNILNGKFFITLNFSSFCVCVCVATMTFIIKTYKMYWSNQNIFHRFK